MRRVTWQADADEYVRYKEHSTPGGAPSPGLHSSTGPGPLAHAPHSSTASGYAPLDRSVLDSTSSPATQSTMNSSGTSGNSNHSYANTYQDRIPGLISQSQSQSQSQPFPRGTPYPQRNSRNATSSGSAVTGFSGSGVVHRMPPASPPSRQIDAYHRMRDGSSSLIHQSPDTANNSNASGFGGSLASSATAAAAGGVGGGSGSNIHGGGAWIENPCDHWVTVFGFPASRSSRVVAEFSRIGLVSATSIVSPSNSSLQTSLFSNSMTANSFVSPLDGAEAAGQDAGESGHGNWIHLRFVSRTDALHALSWHSRLLFRDTMIGVTRTEPEVVRLAEEQAAGGRIGSVRKSTVQKKRAYTESIEPTMLFEQQQPQYQPQSQQSQQPQLQRPGVVDSSLLLAEPAAKQPRIEKWGIWSTVKEFVMGGF
eukprot:ANDGO_06242.mRNA.1 hypothetical protein